MADIDLGWIIRDVEAGVASALDRWDAASENAAYAHMQGLSRVERWEGESSDDFDARLKQTSTFAASVLDVLSRDLWTPGPSRSFDSPAVGEFLDLAYRRADVNAKLTEAERDAVLGGASAIEVWPTGDPDEPIRLFVYGPEEFHPYFADDDPANPAAVVTKGEVPGGATRYQLWTRERFYEFRTRGRPSSGALTTVRDRAVLIREAENPYRDARGRGVLPFCWHWPAPPVKAFWGRSIGSELRATNAVIDMALSTLAALIHRHGLPRGFVSGAQAKWNVSGPPGTFQPVPPSTNTDLIDGPPSVFLVEATLQQVPAIWDHIRATASMKLEDLGVPATLVYGDGSTDLSGVAVIAKALPLYERTRKRQGQVEDTERRLASLACLVAGTHYRQPVLLAAASDPGLALDWPEPQMPLPTPDRLAGDKAELDLGIKSKIELLMERRGLTRSQAIEAYRRILEDERAVAEIEAEMVPIVTTPPAAPGPSPAAVAVDAPSDDTGGL